MTKTLPEGFTLLEVLLANMLSAILFSLLLFLYSNILRNFLYVSSLTEILENSRFATHFFKQQLLDGAKRCRQKNLHSPYIVGLKNNMSMRRLRKQSDAFEIFSCTHEPFTKIKFFISETDRNTSALFMKEGVKHRLEIINNVSDFRILYGIKCAHSENICAYQKQEEVRNWYHVVSVQISMLLGVGKNSKWWQLYLALR